MTSSTNNPDRSLQVAREDLTMFINACFACTGQREFYGSKYSPRVSIAFLHEYILGNYRLLYARTLAAGINHFNQAQIVLNLLETGRHARPEHRAEENALINAALRELPPQRAWKLWEQARRRGINNRRTRALARDYLARRRNQSLDAVKYRGKVRSIALHAHLKLEGELSAFLFRFRRTPTFATPLFEKFRQAHYSVEAVYNLPYTIAEGLAHKHRIPREQFLARIAAQMTEGEKLRLQTATQDMKRVELEVDWTRLPLTRLALYILSLPLEVRRERLEELTVAMRQSAQVVLRRSPLRLGKTASILDCSYSSSGSSEKRLRPLGIALAAHFLLEQAAQEYRAFWTRKPESPLLVEPRGQTNMVMPLLDALQWEPEQVVIISDGYENDPPCGAQEVLRIFRAYLDKDHRVSISQCNPVFVGDDYAPHALSPLVPTVGLRDAEDLPTVLGFARFADASATLAELEAYLKTKVSGFLKRPEYPTSENLTA